MREVPEIMNRSKWTGLKGAAGDGKVLARNAKIPFPYQNFLKNKFGRDYMTPKLGTTKNMGLRYYKCHLLRDEGLWIQSWPCHVMFTAVLVRGFVWKWWRRCCTTFVVEGPPPRLEEP